METRSVKDFGAVGDGITDDTPALEMAYDWANNGEGRTIYFPPGTFKTGRPIRMSRTLWQVILKWIGFGN